MFCDSLIHQAATCPQGAFGPQPMPVPAHAPYEGAIIAGIICLTLIILALVVKCLLDNLYKLKYPTVQPKSDDVLEKEKVSQRMNTLNDKLLAFQENLAKNGSQHATEEQEYRKITKSRYLKSNLFVE